jgi:predicted nucleic acid-binding protein
MNAVDTNVLLYVHDPRDVTKQASAANLLQSLADGVLLWQVACEYLAASRKLVPFGYNLPQAYEDVRDLSVSYDLPTVCEAIVESAIRPLKAFLAIVVAIL